MVAGRRLTLVKVWDIHVAGQVPVCDTVNPVFGVDWEVALALLDSGLVIGAVLVGDFIEHWMLAACRLVLVLVEG